MWMTLASQSKMYSSTLAMPIVSIPPSAFLPLFAVLQSVVVRTGDCEECRVWIFCLSLHDQNTCNGLWKVFYLFHVSWRGSLTIVTEFPNVLMSETYLSRCRM